MKPNNRYRLLYSNFTQKFSIMLDANSSSIELNDADIQQINEIRVNRDVLSDSALSHYALASIAESMTLSLNRKYNPDEYPEFEEVADETEQ